MSPHLRVLALVCLLLWSCSGVALGQGLEEHLAAPLVADSPDVMLEVNEPTDVTFSLSAAFPKDLESPDYLRQGHVYSSVDLAMLSVTDRAFRTNGGEFVVSPRFQLGWERMSGFGIRGKYSILERVRDSTFPATSGLPFQYNHQFYLDYEVESLIVDFYQRFLAGRSKLLLGAGLHGIRNDQEFEHIYDSMSLVPYGWSISYPTEETNSGVGLTVVSELERNLFAEDSVEVSIVLNGRTSYVPAEFRVDHHYFTGTTDNDIWVIEGSIGLEMLKRFQRLALSMRSQFESQYWSSEVTIDQAFTGASVSLGLAW